MTLLQKTKKIVTSSIKSVIFIDEKALENYQKKSLHFISEEELSINLNNNFKKKGISLSVHKFKESDLTDINRLDYFFKRRDLVLLDWKLDGNNGEEYSLNLLSKVVKQKHIHFCCIYTSEANYGEIINNISTYFSGYNKEYYDNIIAALDVYKEANEELFNQISFDNYTTNATLFNNFRVDDGQLPLLIKQVTNLSDFGKALVQVKYAFSVYHKSDIINPIPSHINRTNYTLNINNTIITIIPKTENSAVKILNKLYRQIHKSENCFSQILGLDMQNSFSEQTSFIDRNLLNTSLDTILHHRKELLKRGGDYEFELFIKEILQEQAKLTLNNAELVILESAFLNRESIKSRKRISDSDLSILNTFYNGSFLKNKDVLNFGDIFYDIDACLYYLCITPLCDCLYPENIKNNFFFVSGSKVPNIDLALKTGDGNFKSYIDEGTCIKWTKPVNDWSKGDYIKPLQLHIPNPKIINNNILVQYINEGCHVSSNLNYVFTLKNQYAQRIANHTFSHPLRVGVDFVKK